MGKKEEDFKKGLRNYKTQVDVFMPHLPKIIVDHPIHPERKMEEAELLEEYNKIYDNELGKEDEDR